MDQIKRMSIKEFREEGFLQEANRKFFHPLGLALEVIIEDDGTERLGGIWDYREDKEGMFYGKYPSVEKADYVERLRLSKEQVRKHMLNIETDDFGIQKVA